MAAAVQDGTDLDGVGFDGVVDGEGESPGEGALEFAINFPVDGPEDFQRLDIRVEDRQKIAPEAGLPCFIEAETLDEVGFRHIESPVSCDGGFDFLTGHFPVNESGLTRIEQSFAFVEHILVPLRHFDLAGVTGEVIPKRFHDEQFVL